MSSKGWRSLVVADRDIRDYTPTSPKNEDTAQKIFIDHQNDRRFLNFSPRCGCPPAPAELVAIVASNGHKQYRLRCTICDHGSLHNNIPYDLLTRQQRADARIYRTNPPSITLPCERCGAMPGEYHHWAPQSKFEDAWSWPASWLCRACHMRWHKIMSTSAEECAFYKMPPLVSDICEDETWMEFWPSFERKR
jgi:hypothetical protein